MRFTLTFPLSTAIYVHPNAGKAAAANAKKVAESSRKEKQRSNPYTKSARPRSKINIINFACTIV